MDADDKAEAKRKKEKAVVEAAKAAVAADRLRWDAQRVSNQMVSAEFTKHVDADAAELMCRAGSHVACLRLIAAVDALEGE